MNPDVPTTTVDDVPWPLGPEWTVLDVREDHEWAAGHIPGARHIPLGQLPARFTELDSQSPTLVVCHLGGRSARATAWLSGQGHQVVNLEGGMEAWEAAQRPTE